MSYYTTGFDSRVIGLLKKGGVGLLPSDTIYGLSCRALDEQAVARLYRLKNRNQNKPSIILIGRVSQLTELGIDSPQAELAKPYWPGPLSLIFNSPNSPQYLHRGAGSLAVRLPDNKSLAELILQVGPIISTSANLQNGQPANNVEEARGRFGDKLDFYVDIGDLSGRYPSTLAQIQDGKLHVIRSGAVKLNT